MAKVRFLIVQVLACGSALFGGVACAFAAAPDDSPVTFTRQVTFELTFANRDMIWLGDPASPTATVYVRPNARPIATDVCVRTNITNHSSRGRHYLREARLVADGDTRVVHAFTERREKIIGVVDGEGRFVPNEFYAKNRELLPTWPADASILAYDPAENALYYEVDLHGPQVSESLDFLPLDLEDATGNSLVGVFSIGYTPTADGHAAKNASVSLTFESRGNPVALATATVPSVFRREDVQLGSFDNQAGTYLSEDAYRPRAGSSDVAEPSVTVTVAGEFTSAVKSVGDSLVLVAPPGTGDPPEATRVPARIAIDGNFEDWRNVAGVDDRRGDSVPYLEYIADVDLLEFKVAHDERHIYLYARVAGQVGRSHPDGGRAYFYAYMDVDQDAGTGFLPTRDDDCYFGVDIGDDCEVQFEFVNNRLRKTFYGFCGIGGNENVLKQQVTLGKSIYGRFDEHGAERANYKAEYTYRGGVTEITEDLKLGTSDTIRLAVSPDGSEVEVVSDFSGFLKDTQGRPTLGIGQTIDLAVGMECDSKAYLGKTRWAADSTVAIRGYQLRATKHNSR